MHTESTSPEPSMSTAVRKMSETILSSNRPSGSCHIVQDPPHQNLEQITIQEQYKFAPDSPNVPLEQNNIADPKKRYSILDDGLEVKQSALRPLSPNVVILAQNDPETSDEDEAVTKRDSRHPKRLSRRRNAISSHSFSTSPKPSSPVEIKNEGSTKNPVETLEQEPNEHIEDIDKAPDTDLVALPSNNQLQVLEDQNAQRYGNEGSEMQQPVLQHNQFIPQPSNETRRTFQLLVLTALHSDTCYSNKCRIHWCPKIANTMSHMGECDKAFQCGNWLCWSLKCTLDHWNECTTQNCYLCSPINTLSDIINPALHFFRIPILKILIYRIRQKIKPIICQILMNIPSITIDRACRQHSRRIRNEYFDRDENFREPRNRLARRFEVQRIYNTCTRRCRREVMYAIVRVLEGIEMNLRNEEDRTYST